MSVGLYGLIKKYDGINTIVTADTETEKKMLRALNLNPPDGVPLDSVHTRMGMKYVQKPSTDSVRYEIVKHCIPRIN